MYNDRKCPGCMNEGQGEQICSICGCDMTSQNDSSSLPIRFLLSERYVIGKALSVNGEGITYIAWDNASDTAVHVKEYFPKGIAARNPDKTVTVLAGNEFYFNEGLLDFIEINKRLIATELQAIVPVLTVFEENGTVYAVTPITPSITLQSFLDRNGGSLRWEQVRPLFLPLIDTLSQLHEMGVIHGGISPETIMVGRDGKLRLTGICVPRLRMASVYAAAELYTGYAAVEQYGKTDAILSVASDVYAFSAVLFRVLIGTVPPSAELRMQKDTLSIPSRFADELPRQVLVAIANGMQINVQNRTETIEIFKNELVYGETPENLRKAASNKAAEQKARQTEPEAKKSSGVKYAVISAAVTVAVFVILILILNFTGVLDKLFGSKEEPKKENSSQSSSEIDSNESSEPDDTSSEKDYSGMVPVPDVRGKYFSDLEDLEEYEDFVFILNEDNKAYSDSFPRGTICEQSIKDGEMVDKGTEIKVTISLGKKEISMVGVIGLTQDEAKYKLLTEGFLLENVEIVPVYYVDKTPNVIVEQTPAAGDKVSLEEHIVLEWNSYQGEEEDVMGSQSNPLGSTPTTDERDE